MFHDLTVKPWVTAQGAVENLHDRATARKLALKVFLAVVTVLFMLLIVAYGRRMAYEDWRPSPPLRLLRRGTSVIVRPPASVCDAQEHEQDREDRRSEEH